MLQHLILLAQNAKKIDDATRARAMSSVLLVLLAGVFLLLVIMLGAHFFRRWLRHSRARASKATPDDLWYAKPLDEASDSPPPPP